MLVHISKSVRYLALSCCFAGINGCSTDGAIGDLALLGALGGSMMPGVDSGTVAALGAVAVGSLVAAPLLSSNSETGASPSSSPAAVPATPGVGVAAPTTAAALIAAEVPDAYRNKSCDYLEVAVLFAHERLIGRTKANDIEGQQVAQARIAARSQALNEKNCPPSTWVGGRIGISMDNIDPRYVAIYKIPAEGALVLMVGPKSTAETAGVKVGDVIIAVNDKPILDAIDLRTVLGHAPIGSVQRLKIRRDTTFLVANTEMAGPAIPLPTFAALYSSPVATPPGTQPPLAGPAKMASAVNYCYAYLTVGETRGSTCSPVVEISDTDRTGSIFKTRLTGYVDKVKQSQPGIWGDFEYSETIKMQNAFIYQMKPKASATVSKQDVGLICYESRADADAQLKQSQKNDSSLKIVGWP